MIDQEIDREKVLHGLSSCGNDYGLPNICEVTECPYREDKPWCVHLLAHDARMLVAELLKAQEQEPRVMTIGDLYGNDMGYYERKDEGLLWPVLITRGGPDSDGTVGLVRKDAFEIMADCGLINQTWRIWTAYPTFERREVTPWN